MRFYFDIDDELFEDEYGIDFKETVKNGVVQSITEMIYSHSTDAQSCYSVISKQIENLIKTNAKEICEAVVDRVAADITRRKVIRDITPKASELASADKENIAYFEQMIDKAIAKRFGK